MMCCRGCCCYCCGSAANLLLHTSCLHNVPTCQGAAGVLVREQAACCLLHCRQKHTTQCANMPMSVLDSSGKARLQHLTTSVWRGGPLRSTQWLHACEGTQLHVTSTHTTSTHPLPQTAPPALATAAAPTPGPPCSGCTAPRSCWPPHSRSAPVPASSCTVQSTPQGAGSQGAWGTGASREAASTIVE